MPTRKITRNTETGKFTNNSNAKTDKKGTVVETVKEWPENKVKEILNDFGVEWLFTRFSQKRKLISDTANKLKKLLS